MKTKRWKKKKEEMKTPFFNKARIDSINKKQKKNINSVKKKRQKKNLYTFNLVNLKVKKDNLLIAFPSLSYSLPKNN